jgi:hypothetical protein
MADRVDSEIISAYLFGEGLNAFRDTFKSTCRRLGIPDALQALERLSNEGKHTLALS